MDFFVGKKLISYSKIVLARRTNIGRHTMGAKSEKKNVQFRKAEWPEE